MKVSSVPFEQGRHPRGPLTPTAVVLHRTFGRWAGDYSIGKNGRGGQPIGFHFLIGKTQAVQFYDTAVKCNHAAGANSWAVGIEFEGTNADALTDFQVATGADVIRSICAAHAIPLTYETTGPRRKVNGCLPHLLVPGSDHTDLVTAADWARMFTATPPPYIPPPSEEDDMPGYLFSDGQHIWLTDGLSKRIVPFNGDRFNELAFLGQAKNQRKADGGLEIPTNAAYLADIPIA